MAHGPHDDFVVANRREVEAWLGAHGTGNFERFVEELVTPLDDVHIFAAVTDPNAPIEIVESVNLALPEMILSSAAQFGFRVTTYGSALEALGPTANRYLETKRYLAAMVDDFARNGTDAFHIRFHTVYGSGVPQPHMFLGQILDALLSETPFNMTSGEQLREYHHVDDVVAAISILNDNRIGSSATISHGMPVRLRDLAEAIFSSFDRIDMLNIGTVSSEQTDVYESLVTETLGLEGIHFREPISGVVDYIQQAFAASTRQNERGGDS